MCGQRGHGQCKQEVGHLFRTLGYWRIRRRYVAGTLLNGVPSSTLGPGCIIMLLEALGQVCMSVWLHST